MMDIQEALLEIRSLSQIPDIASYIAGNKIRFGILMKLALSDEKILSERASWAANHAAYKNQYLLSPWIGKIIKRIELASNSSVKRNLLRLLEGIEIQEKYQGKMLEIGYKLLFSSKEPVAVKVFTMTVLSNIAKQHPDLKDELKIVISDLMLTDAKPSIVARGKITLKNLA